MIRNISVCRSCWSTVWQLRSYKHKDTIIFLSKRYVTMTVPRSKLNTTLIGEGVDFQRIRRITG